MLGITSLSRYFNLIKLHDSKNEENPKDDDDPNKTSVESVRLGKTSDLSENLSWIFSTPF